MATEILEVINEVEVIDYVPTTKMYRKRLIKKLSIVLVCSLLILLTRFFDKYIQFDIIMTSGVFLILLYNAILLGLGISVYLPVSKKNIGLEKTDKTHKTLLNIFDLLSIVPIFIAVISLSNAFVISSASVVGQSMEPNYYEGQDIMMWHLTTNYERFDTIVLETDSNEYYLKRIIGMPGDRVVISHSIIMINGEVIDQEFLKEDDGSISVYTYCNTDLLKNCEFNVPRDSYFVLGDNREHSLDSRSYLLGYVHEDQIYGKVIMKFNNIFR